MQIQCLLVFLIFEQPEGQARIIMLALIVEHVFSLCFLAFKSWEIEREGALDLNGVARAPKETFLAYVEMFIICIIFGYSLNYLTGLTWEEFHSKPFVHDWILCDCLILCLQLGFVYSSQITIVKSETIKNIYTLCHIQRAKVKKERERQELEQERLERPCDIGHQACIALKMIKDQDDSDED